MQQGKISCLAHCHFFAAIIHRYFDESSDELSYREADRAPLVQYLHYAIHPE